VASVMCAYNRFNGTSSCHNAGLLGPQGILQKAGFKGKQMLMTRNVRSFHAVEQVMFLAIGVQHMIRLRTMQMLV
jgi:hypothetical protein